VLHLFKRVYLSSDHMIDLSVNRIVISEEYGYKMLHESESFTTGKLIDYDLSLDNMIGSNKRYVNALDFFSNLNKKTEELNGKIVVYCDLSTYLTLSITWLKIILPNITLDGAYKIIRSNVFYDKMFGSTDRFDFKRPYEKISEFKEISYLDFKSKYDSIEINNSDYDNFVYTIRKNLSVEYMIASYLYDGSYSDELKEVGLVKIKMSIQHLLYEVKIFILENCLNSAVMKLFGCEREYSLNTVDEITKESTFDIWFDKDIWTFDGICSTNNTSKINFKNISDEQYDKFVSHIKIFYSAFNDILCKPNFLAPLLENDDMLKNRLHSFEISRKNIMTDDDLKYIIASQEQEILIEPVDPQKFNLFFMQELRNINNTGIKQNLLQYTLL
jgi:hypothetical protein